jgi:L-ribulokinase
LAEITLGLDFGTGSARAVLVDCKDGATVAAAVCAYPHGEAGVVLDPAEPELARQHPADHVHALTQAIREALRRAAERAGVAPSDVVGVGVDATASTPLPVDARLRPLALDPAFAGSAAALAWLWKDHTARAEAAEITALARAQRPEYLARCGGTYSSEWYWAKLLCCARSAPEVFDAAAAWFELCDYVPAWLCGIRDPERAPRSVCAAGHKGLWAASWGGYPDLEFLRELDPRLAAVRARMSDALVLASDRAVGGISAEVAAATGLPAGLPVAVGGIDAHFGAVGAGVGVGDLVKVIGTSTCDMAVTAGRRLPAVEGLCGVVPGSIVPGLVGIEAGQSAVGDIYAWSAREIGQRSLPELEAAAAQLRPGASGLLALDWHNGNRCVLVDPALSGLLVGLGLQTTAAEIHRAMIEATAFGARVIVERMVESGIPVERIVACGGIATKSPLCVQIHADVLGREVLVAPAGETCALGAAIFAAVVAGRHPDTAAAQRAMCGSPAASHRPEPAHAAVYERLFRLYRRLHDAFGVAGSHDDLADVMKELLAIRRAAR